MGRAFVALPVLACVLAAGSPALPADSDTRQRKPSVVDLQVKRQGEALQVSYRLENVFSDEVEEKIEAGISVRFRHRVEVTTRHWMPLWPRGVVATGTVEATVTYDSLTHRFELSRVIESSSRKKGKSQPQTVHASTVHESEALAWMADASMFPPLDLSTLPEDATARVRAESSIGRKWVVLVPTRRTVSADHKLEPGR